MHETNSSCRLGALQQQDNRSHYSDKSHNHELVLPLDFLSKEELGNKVRTLGGPFEFSKEIYMHPHTIEEGRNAVQCFNHLILILI